MQSRTSSSLSIIDISAFEASITVSIMPDPVRRSERLRDLQKEQKQRLLVTSPKYTVQLRRSRRAPNARIRLRRPVTHHEAPIMGRPLVLTLPSELLELIAEHAEPADLLALRRTCRDTAAATFRAYTKAHFTHKIFVVDCPRSMQNLLSISEHTVYGTSLEKVTLSTQLSVSPWQRPDREDSRTGTLRELRQRPQAIKVHRSNHQESACVIPRSGSGEIAEISSDFPQSTGHFLRLFPLIATLRNALANFANVGNAVCLNVNDLDKGLCGKG